MFYQVAKIVLWIYCVLFFKVDVQGRENIPKKGSAVLCANHASNYDPIFLAAFIKRHIHFMAKKELFESKKWRPFLIGLKAYPVDRDKPDMASFRQSIELLKKGSVIGIFAQGTRVKEGEEKSAKAGVSLFALKGKAPVVPVAISGTFRPFSKVYIHFGRAIELDAYYGQKMGTKALSELAEEIMAQVEALRVDA